MTKEEKELFDALSREKGEAMSPFEELTLLGYYEDGKAAFINKENEIVKMEVEGVSEGLRALWESINSKDELNWSFFDEYDFDENDEQYKLLDDVLKLNCDRRKYFA